MGEISGGLSRCPLLQYLIHELTIFSKWPFQTILYRPQLSLCFYFLFRLFTAVLSTTRSEKIELKTHIYGCISSWRILAHLAHSNACISYCIHWFFASFSMKTHFLGILFELGCRAHLSASPNFEDTWKRSLQEQNNAVAAFLPAKMRIRIR